MRRSKKNREGKGDRGERKRERMIRSKENRRREMWKIIIINL